MQGGGAEGGQLLEFRAERVQKTSSRSKSKSEEEETQKPKSAFAGPLVLLNTMCFLFFVTSVWKAHKQDREAEGLTCDR